MNLNGKAAIIDMLLRLSISCFSWWRKYIYI